MRASRSDLKPVWGKRPPIQVPKSASYARILSKGIEKWVAFDRKFDGDEDYVVLYDDGSHAIFLPGKEGDFHLETYKTELGKDFKRIKMYFLCTATDYEKSQDGQVTESEPVDSMYSRATESTKPQQSAKTSYVSPTVDVG